MHRQTDRQKQTDHNNPLLSSSVNEILSPSDYFSSKRCDRSFECLLDVNVFHNITIKL